MVMMIQRLGLDSDRLVEAIAATFSQRDSHSVPDLLAPPPENWTKPFAVLAKETGLAMTAEEAFEEVR